MKKLSLILVLALVLSVFTGFAGVAEEEPVELTFIDRYGAWEWESTPLTEKLEELFNVKITRKAYAAVDGSSWYALAILSGETPAYISDMPTSELNKYARQGLFKELSMEMLEENAPDMLKWINDEWVENWADFASVDGTLYAIPVLWSLSNHWDTVGIRKDICDALGVDTPHTIAELENFMALAKETYNMDYVLSTYDGIGTMQFVLGAYDVYRNSWYQGNDGNLYWWAYHPNAKEAVTKLHDWYAAGYIDPEFQTNDFDMFSERWANGKCFVGVDYWPDFVEAGVWGDTDAPLYGALKEANPDATIDCVGTPSSDLGNGGWASDPWCGWFVFSSELTDEQLAKYLQCFNYCSQNIEGLMLCNKGVEGVHYTVDDNDVTTWLEPADTQEKRDALGLGQNFPGNFNNYTVQYPFFTHADKAEIRKYWEDGNYTRPNILAATEREQWNDWGTAFKDYCDKNLIDFMVGTRDLAEWDNFINELDTQYHGQDLVAEAEATLASVTTVIDKYNSNNG